MKNKWIYFSHVSKILGLILLASCSYFSLISKEKVSKGPLKKGTTQFILKDKAGSFLLYREKGFLKGNKEFIVKRKIVDKDKTVIDENILEQSITISTKSLLDNKITVLRPKLSEYSVWFDKKRYKNRMEFDDEKKQLVVTLNSPEAAFSGRKVYPFPKNKTGVFCYFSQLIECSAITEFVEIAIKKGRGVMNFYIIWEGFPYVGEQYEKIPNSPFAKAQLRFDGQNSLGEKRFSLNIVDQTILYFVDKNLQFKKLFWPSQGLSLIPKEEVL